MVAQGEELSWADIATVARAQCELGNYAEADSAVGRLDASAPEAAEFAAVVDNAGSYLHGVSALAAGDAARAATFLDDAYATAPGEAACALALAVALANTGDASRLDEAADLYQQVAVTDPTWVSALAGLASSLERLNRPTEAAKVLTAVPTTHPLRADALTLACHAMEQGTYDLEVAAAAGERVRSVPAGSRDAAEAALAAGLYSAALAAVARGEQVGDEVAGVHTSPTSLARGAEAALLDLADATPNPAQRHQLLDSAARVRPWSLW
jgi:tetratricopeptide (TPR) repeat protein